MVKTNQFEYLKKVVNVMTYINFSQISCMTFKLLSKLKDIKRFAKSSDRYFFVCTHLSCFPPPHSTNTSSNRFEVPPIKKF